jgi:peptide/nickel transport system permease protein
MAADLQHPAVPRSQALPALDQPPQPPAWRQATRSFARHRLAVAGMLILLAISLGAVFAPYLTPYEPNKTAVLDRLEPPSAEHWMGTDELGRDVLTRILYSGRISLVVGLASIAVSVTLGVLVGAFAGYAGGVFDSLLMRFTDVMISFPQLFVLILLASFLDQSLATIVLSLGLISWMPMARLVRAEFLALKSKDFVIASRALGVSTPRLILRHLLPNGASSIIVAATLGVAAAIRAESGLSYLGLGLQPPTASWGTMLRNAQEQFLVAPWTAIFPGFMIFVTVMSVNFMGDGLRDALDPHHTLQRPG